MKLHSGLLTENHEGTEDLITGLMVATAKATELSIAPFRISPLEYRILDKCHKGDANTVTELARIFPVYSPTISRRVSKLVDRGLIRRRRLSSDRRTVRLSLTEEGRVLVQTLSERLKSIQVVLMNEISNDEWESFTATAHKIMASLADKTLQSSIQGGPARLGPTSW